MSQSQVVVGKIVQIATPPQPTQLDGRQIVMFILTDAGNVYGISDGPGNLIPYITNADDDRRAEGST